MIVFADFNSFDSDGFIRLHYPKTEAQLKAANIAMREGLELTVSDGDITADVVVCAPGPEGIWRGKIVGEMHDRS
ncbi:hypothetical protein [Tahibacter harae]|uniref:Uncharacterized protein n=1 Tax=Tahibacter harae TaxID=2963937 RepID=A0ABT1QU90_9GAMM|nr:hypothetical protein [Tahibacter harae]MCQ4165837.1 hypothetical protein [Tahibacter harae]